MARKDGEYALQDMVLSDGIRGRLSEVFCLKTYRVNHVVHGAIAMVVAHSTPFHAIQAGKQLSDSKGASAAICAEFAITAVKRSMNGHSSLVKPIEWNYSSAWGRLACSHPLTTGLVIRPVGVAEPSMGPLSCTL